MTERLDRIEAILETSARQQAKQGEDIDTLLGAIATTEALVNRVTVKAEGNELICDTLRAEARADRLETRQLWNDAVTQMETDRTKTQKRAETDRTENSRRFDAQQEVIQRLLIELVEMNRDNRRLRDHLDGLGRAS